MKVGCTDMSKLTNLLRKDFKVVYRDNFVFFLVLYPLVGAGVMRLALPYVPIPNLGTYLAPFLLVLGATAVGVIQGFSLIEEKENQTSVLLKVLPIDLTTHLLYLAGVGFAVSALMSLVALLIYGYPVVNLPAALFALLVSATTGPVLALVIGTLANNKIEGLALTKSLGFAMVAPVIVFMASPQWHFIAWWNPWYWCYLAGLHAYAPQHILDAPPVHWPRHPLWATLVIPLLLSAVAIVRLYQAYQNRH